MRQSCKRLSETVREVPSSQTATEVTQELKTKNTLMSKNFTASKFEDMQTVEMPHANKDKLICCRSCAKKLEQKFYKRMK